MFICIYTYR